MLFSTNQGNIKPQILFNNEDVEFVVNHKHLGVTFSSNCKWHCLIQNILKSTSGQLSMLRKFKIKLNRENLEKIYFTYIRPLLEYACELSDGCTILDLKKMDKYNTKLLELLLGCQNGIMSLLRHSILRQSLLRHSILRQSLLRHS